MFFPDRTLNIRPDSFFNILRFIRADSSLDIRGLPIPLSVSDCLDPMRWAEVDVAASPH
jgi:hypothetical protein